MNSFAKLPNIIEFLAPSFNIPSVPLYIFKSAKDIRLHFRPCNHHGITIVSSSESVNYFEGELKNESAS